MMYKYMNRWFAFICNTTVYIAYISHLPSVKDFDVIYKHNSVWIECMLDGSAAPFRDCFSPHPPLPKQTLYDSSFPSVSLDTSFYPTGEVDKFTWNS